MTGDDDYGNIMVEDGVGNNRTSSCDDVAKKILNMSRYSFHPFVNNEKSLMEIGKERLGDLQSKRKKNRQKVILLKDAVRGAHKEKLEKENRVQERLDEYLSDANVETNADSRVYHAIYLSSISVLSNILSSIIISNPLLT